MAKRVRPQRLIITVVSEPRGLVDMEISLERGGTVTLNLEDGPESDRPFKLNLPDGMLRDQQKFVCDKAGMRPA